MPPTSVPGARVCKHIHASLSVRCHSVTVLQQGYTWQMMALRVCVYTCVWHVCRHRHGVHTGASDCAPLEPYMESWHIWSAVWGLGQWGDAHMLLCNAKPQVPPML